jgi:hypothetical protein
MEHDLLEYPKYREQREKLRKYVDWNDKNARGGKLEYIKTTGRLEL